MNILQVNKFFWMKGGAERYFFMVSEDLERRGHNVAHFAMAHPDNVPSPWADYFVSSRDYGDAGGPAATLSHGLSFIRSREAAGNMRRLIRDFRPDVAHLHNIYHQLTPSIIEALSRSGVPVVMTLHDYKLICPNYSHFARGKYCYRCRGGKYYHAPLERCSGGLSRSLLLCAEAYWQKWTGVYRHVDRLIAPSRFMRDRVAGAARDIGLDPDRVVYLASYCPPAETAAGGASVEESRLLDELPPDPVVYFGRLSVEKGVDTLLAAAARQPAVPVVICGDGPARAELEARVKSEALGNVVFTGHVGKAVLDGILAGALAAVLPAIWPENAPFTVIEAAAASVPLIVSDMGGLPEMAGIVGGTVVPHGDAGALAEAIGRLRDDPEAARAQGAAGRGAAARYFEQSAHLVALEKIYEEVAQRS